jgi:lipopolysaccharide/colanic/teichoic acid biosynthesis glycosyltransferase
MHIALPELPPGRRWWHYADDRKPLLTGRFYELTKRAFDLTLLFVTLPLTLPLLLLCALLIALDSPGAPVIFTQMRTGRYGLRFRLYKFRTMVPDAEERKSDLMHLNELQWPDFKIAEDPRVTRVGRLLRKSSLDELPQLLNILKGEMSFVGPRPTSFHPDTYKLWHTERLEVVPGLTGLWQVSGRSNLEFDDRVRLDIAYIRRRSLTLDLLILIRTFGAVWSQDGAG